MTVYGPVITGRADFGPIVGGDDVEDWCLTLLKRWSSTYLSEVERKAGLQAGFYARPRSYVRTISFDTFPEDQVPRVMLVSTGIATPPAHHGDGSLDARWLMGLACVCSAATQEGSQVMTRRYMKALRTLFLQRSTLDGHANGTQWLDERYDDLAWDDMRSLGSAQAHFAVEVADVGNTDLGPVTEDAPFDPDTQPWPPWEDVASAEITVVKEPLDADLDAQT